MPVADSPSRASDGESPPPVRSEPTSLVAHRRRRPGRWIAAAVIVLVVAAGLRSVVTNSRFEWDIVLEYLFSREILEGVGITIALTVIAMVIGIALGTVLAIMRLSPNPVVTSASTAYITFFRGTPVLVQVIFWFNLAALYPMINLGIPFLAPDLFSFDANRWITPLAAAILGLGLNEAAYMSEIVRAGLQSVDKGQTRAAQALGMGHGLTLRRIVLPQAMRFMIPPTGNEVIGMLKTTSIVSFIALADLLYASQLVYTRTYQVIPLLIVASIWYLILTTILYTIQTRIERHYGRGFDHRTGGRRERGARWAAFRTARASRGHG